MGAVVEPGDDQVTGWDGTRGQGWVAIQDVVSRLFEPLQDLLVAAVGSCGAERVLDVGCGTGDTTLAIARWLGPSGDCTGIDISAPMLAAARRRAEQEGLSARFVQADAQRHQFDPASVDMIVSRFGVMFFDDAVHAFANLRTALNEGGAVRFIAWRRAAENSFMTTAERAAAAYVTIPPSEPDAPGQFAFAEERRVRAVLEQSGWRGVDIQPIDVACTMREEDLVPYLTHLGPVGRVVADMDVSTRTRVLEAVRPAFDPFVDEDEVRFTASCWMVGAET